MESGNSHIGKTCEGIQKRREYSLWQAEEAVTQWAGQERTTTPGAVPEGGKVVTTEGMKTISIFFLILVVLN
jgi:hypothetical protein